VESKVPTAHIRSTGCISNLLDGTGYEQLLKEAGYRLVKDVGNAELILLNTCAFNRLKEEEAIRLIERAKVDKKKGARILVCGCLPEINRERLQKIHNGVTFGPKDKSELLKLLQNRVATLPDINAPISYYQYSPLKKVIYQSKRLIEFFPLLNRVSIINRVLGSLFIYAKDVFCLKVETGCWGSCTYCAIRLAKGRTVSRPLEEISAEFNRAIDEGYRKFVLVGDEITSYGRDISQQLDILDIIDELIKNERLKILYLESFEPSFMISNFDRILEVLAGGKIPVFCSSVQSGSNRILKEMNRHYKPEDYISCMKEIRKKYPKIYLRNEIIVGFPGETEDDFLESLDLVSQLTFDLIDVYEYEDRPNTAASRMPHKIPAHEKNIRRKRILRQYWKNLLLKKN